MSETLEEAAERFYNESRFRNPKSFFCEGAKWMYKQSIPHPIRQHHLIELEALYAESKITHSRMVEILNEIAAGKHKEGIEV